MFALRRSLIGWMALTLGCVCTSAATSVHAQDASAPTESADADPQTGVRGRIVDAKSGLGIEMAPVLIIDRERTRSAITITNGAYELNVPPGVYTVRSFYDLYHGARLANVRVSRGRFSEVNLLLDPVNEVEEIAVEEIEVPYRADTTTAAAQDEMRRASSGIGEGMGSQQMSQSGASDAGSAAKRVVGVTIEGSNLVIRGLGGRYARVYMNGVPLPSTDPDSPSVDLDLFPTDVISSLTVTKAFLPNMPADFAGGVLNIETVTFPRELIFELSLSTQYSSQATFRNRMDYEGGNLDFLGIDDGTRAMPDAIPTTRYKPREDDDLSIARSFNDTWSRRKRTAMPNFGLALTLGNAIDIGSSSRFGYLIALGYDHKDIRLTGSSLKFPGYEGATGEVGDLSRTTRYPRIELGTEEVQVSGIATASLDVGADHSLTALTMINRNTSDETAARFGIDKSYDGGLEAQKQQLYYTARQILFNQMLGDHRNLAGTRLRLRWDGFYSTALRDEPDRRSFAYVPSGSDPTPRWVNQSAERIFLKLDGSDGGGGGSLRFPLWNEAWGTVGGLGRYSQRELAARRFRYQIGPDIGLDDYTLPPSILFSNEHLGSLVRLGNEATFDQDSFSTTQTVGSGYVMLETPVVGGLSLITGVRAEVYLQNLTIKSPVAPDEGDEPEPPQSEDRTDVNVLPALALKYEINERMLIRLAYGLTVGRPQARELAPVRYYDFLRDRLIVGNPALTTTTIHNVDVRWEWFFDDAQLIALSLFYKRFKDPIEQYLALDGDSGVFGNSKGAANYGAEIEFRSRLSHLGSALRNFEVGSNLTLVQSQIALSPEQTARTAPGARPMFGQAPYVINLSLRFADPATKASLGLVYNVVGPRLTDVGALVSSDAENATIFPNIHRLPVHSLDLIADWKASDHLKLKFKWKNMLFQSDRWEQGDVIVVRRQPGTFVTVGLDYAY